MALIGEMKYLTIGDSTYSVPSSGGGGGGTVTSVQVQATSPVQSSSSSAQTSILNTTISLADGYGDTKNPYASKTKNKVLASPANASGAPTFRELDASDIPDLSGTYLTSYTETDPTVPSWAKASSKPSYTASEVGAVPTSRTVNGKALSSNITLSASDVSALPSDTSIPTKVSDLTNDSGFTSNTGTVTSVGVSNATNGGLSVSGSPVTGSGSITVGHSNVLTSAQTTQAVYPIKIDKNGHISAYGSAQTIPTKVSDLTNDSGFITGYTETDPTVPAWAKASTKPTYTASEVGAVSLTDGYATDSELLDATTIAIWEDILGISEE